MAIHYIQTFRAIYSFTEEIKREPRIINCLVYDNYVTLRQMYHCIALWIVHRFEHDMTVTFGLRTRNDTPD